MKKKVLILAGYYTPSVKAGGPIQSIKNMVDNLSGEIDFYVIALDRDKGDDIPFQNIYTGKWLQVGNAKVYYVNQEMLTWKEIQQIIKKTEYDFLYLNSFFDYKLSIIPILLSKMRLIKKKPIILAPRGNFSPGALGLKNTKKRILISLSKFLGLHSDVIWHATAQEEKKDIEVIFGNIQDIRIAGNLTANYNRLNYDKKSIKNKGELNIIFISRIHPKKNLKKAIQFLKDIEGAVNFNIYGPIEDNDYWTECKEVINKLPNNVVVTYKGTISHDEVMDTFKEHHVFLFPTLGENYGHVISEALIGGCPVIISDQTPWKQLELHEVGWDIPLIEEEKFVEVLQKLVNLDEEKYELLSRKSFIYGKEAANINKGKEETFILFRDL